LTARQLGGTLAAQSEGCGKGAVFILELPLDTPSRVPTMSHAPPKSILAPALN
jgi:hypothetical protein